MKSKKELIKKANLIVKMCERGKYIGVPACENYSTSKKRDNCERFLKKIESGKLLVKIACGKYAVKSGEVECVECGLMIAMSINHSSFANFHSLINNQDFILEAVKYTPNPKICKDYFYNFINENLKRNRAFRLEFLSNLMQNKNVNDSSLIWFTSKFGFEYELNVLRQEIKAANYVSGKVLVY